MKIRVGSRLIVENPTEEVRAWCKSHLILHNPEYAKKERMGLWLGNTPQHIWLYEEMGDELWMPFGCLQDLWSIIGERATWTLEFCPQKPHYYRSGISLYPYQEEAVTAALGRKNGVLVMPCGSGKTQTGLELIARLGKRALWLTHTQDLLNQSKARAETVLDSAGVGTITAGKVKIGEGITFATVQTLSKLDLMAYRDLWDVIIVDECQHCAGSPTKVTQFYKTISRLSARYKIGLTATPRRADGLERSMYALLGSVIHDVTREQVAETTCPIKLQTVETGYSPGFDSAVFNGDGTLNYSKLVDDLVTDADREACVFREIMRKVYERKPMLVLGSRVVYLQELCKRFNALGEFYGVCMSGMGTSKVAKDARRATLTALNNGEIDCVFASYKLAAEGLDVPNLRYVFFATPEKDATIIQQSVGRVGRAADGKTHGMVIDFVDDFAMYRGWEKKRKTIYKKIGVEVA